VKNLKLIAALVALALSGAAEASHHYRRGAEITGLRRALAVNGAHYRLIKVKPAALRITNHALLFDPNLTNWK
jgi:hypothetical protein